MMNGEASCVVARPGEGLGRVDLDLVVRRAFEDLGAHRLWLDVKVHNLRAQRAYRRAGFRPEGVLRDALLSNDRRESLLVMSIIAPDRQADASDSASHVRLATRTDFDEILANTTSVVHPQGRGVLADHAEVVTVDVDEVKGLLVQKTGLSARPRGSRPTWVQIEILAALWSHGFLLADQIWRRWWPDRTQRWAYQTLKRMTQAGWIDRYKLVVADGGTQQRFYALAQPGFELARGRWLRERQGIPRDATWRQLVLDDTVQLPRSCTSTAGCSPQSGSPAR